MIKKIILLLAFTIIMGNAMAQISFNVKDYNAWSLNTEFDYNLTSYLTNNSTNEADTAFEWNISNVEKHDSWDVTVCGGLVCISNPVGTYDFNLANGEQEVFKLGFSFYDSIGNGSAWVIARSKLNGDAVDSFRLEIRAGTASVKRASDKETFRAYPNPAKDKITVTFSNGGTQNVMIYYILGSLKKSEILTSGSTISVSELPKGVYVMKIEGDNSYSKVIQKQ
jgi:hypothetical protein